MSAQGVRIVVGEGLSTRQGLLRFVLDGEGYDVVAEASTAAELARLIATHHPDVAVLDDGIGATAVGMINEMSPDTKVVLVWPGAVMPVGGAARVEPHRVLQDLGTTVERLTGQRSATGSGHGSTLLERAANDPDLLRAMLLGGMVASDEPIIEDRENAPVVILPLTPTIDHDELILDVLDPEPDDERSGAATGVAAGVAGAAVLASAMPAAAEEAGSTGATVTSIAARGTVGAQSALNRRLGNMALGGAAVASALVLALALGGARVPIEGVSGQAAAISSPSPGTTVSPTPQPDDQPGNDGAGPPDGGNPNDGADGQPATTPDITLVGNFSPTPPGPPDVDIDPGDIGPGGGGGGGGDDGGGGSGGGGTGSDGGGGGDDHNGGGDAGGDHTGGDGGGDKDGGGDHDRGGGNDGDGGDHDNGGGNDGDGGDHDNGGGNDDPDNPGHGGGNGNGGGNGGNGGAH
jgi:uncharacterized membrane protein YgcG